MGTAVQTDFKPQFPVPAGILDDGTQATIEVGVETDADVVFAIAENAAFPDRPKIDLGRIKLQASSGQSISFLEGSTRVQAHASANIATGMGIYASSVDALEALAIDDAPGLHLEFGSGDSGHRYAAMAWGYGVHGAVSGSHPIGALGTVTFGVEAKRDAMFAVLHRFESTSGAHDVIGRCASSWRLPRQVQSARDLASGTWLIAETEGSIAVDIATKLAYDLSFLRESKLLGLTGDIGLKLDSSVKATLGLQVSGRYLMVLGREDESQRLRLRLFKLNKKGHAFGLNLAVGVKRIVDAAPDIADDFVQAVFGVHGRQIVKDLLVVETWTDPKEDLSDTAVGLTNDTALDLLKTVSGLDPSVAFQSAREKLLEGLRAWHALPERVATATWTVIEKATASELEQFRTFLTRLTNRSDLGSAVRWAEVIATAGNGAIPNAGPAAAWLGAIAERGLISLLHRLDEVVETAAQVSSVLSGGIIPKLQAFIADRMNLDRIRTAVNKSDYEAIDGWLVRRLSMFLDEELSFDKLEQVKNTINAVVRKRQSICSAAKKAVERQYSLDFAAAYSSTTSNSAVVDVSFDLSCPGSADVLESVLQRANYDALFKEDHSGVILHTALLTHGIDRRSSVELNMPFLSFRRDHYAQSLARIQAENRGSRVTVYTLDASDEVSVRNRLRSELAVSASIPFPQAGNVRVGDTAESTWSYEYVSVHENMRRSDLEARVAPFVHQYLPDLFSSGGAGSMDTWFSDLDRAVEDVVANGSNEFGDAILTMDVSVPGSALQSWFRNRSQTQLHQDTMNLSRTLQTALKTLVPFYYFQDVSRLRQNSTVAALLTWAALPPCTGAKFSNGILAVNTDNEVFWDAHDPDLRRAMAHSTSSSMRLGSMLEVARKRLMDAGQQREASFFNASEAIDFQQEAASQAGDRLLSSLLAFEEGVVSQAAEALHDVSGFFASAGTSPTEALERLAKLGADITDTFHHRLSTVYGGDSLRTLGSLVFLEAARALDPSLRTMRPNAMLRIMILNEKRSFVLADYLKGERPEPEDIALTQTLTYLRA